MSCYLSTLHAYRSWMPDRQQGYVRRGEGILPKDEKMAEWYRRDANHEEVVITPALQRILIEEALTACEKQTYRAHFIATELTHIHLLLSWRYRRTSLKVRAGLKSSLTRRMNREFEIRPWFSDGGDRKQNKAQSHFDHHMTEYLPKHSGWKWREGDGYFL